MILKLDLEKYPAALSVHLHNMIVGAADYEDEAAKKIRRYIRKNKKFVAANLKREKRV